jgi:hypothetical protein
MFHVIYYLNFAHLKALRITNLFNISNLILNVQDFIMARGYLDSK